MTQPEYSDILEDFEKEKQKSEIFCSSACGIRR